MVRCQMSLRQTYSPIEDFPVPWASTLTTKLGAISFKLEIPVRTSSPRQWLGVVSSHRSKQGYASQAWQNSLQSAIHLAHRQNWGILCAQDTPYFQIIHHTCNRYAIPIRIVQIENSVDSVDSSVVSDTATSLTERSTIRLLIETNEQPDSGASPVHDRAAIFLANNLFVIELKKAGKIARLLTQRLECETIPVGSTYLSLPNSGPLKGVASEAIGWLDRGVVGWLNNCTNATPEPSTLVQKSIDTIQTYQPLLSMDILNSTAPKYLIHCTRSRSGPWPDQSLAQFHDELLHRPWRSQPTVFETLTRILEQQRLIATNTLRRGPTLSVCFSENSIHNLLAMRRFQSHLSRWDWEPYGIMIDREWLIQHGARKVSYVDASVAKNLSNEELAFCQPVSKNHGATNWREEIEWRVPTDLRLNAIPFSKAIVFVPTRAEARLLQRLSKWPIAIATNAT